MLGELSVLNTPDIDCSIAEAFSSGWKPTKCTTVGRRVSGARNNLVTGNDAILYLHVMVGRYSEQVFEEFDLSGEARRTSPRVLDVGLCEELREGTGIMRVYGCNIPIEQRRSDRDSFGVARCFNGRSLERGQCCCAAYQPMNINSGAFEVYDIATNQLTGAASLGSGLDWQVGGFAADPPTGSIGSSGSTSQLVQAMAGFGGSSGAAESLNNVPLAADTSQQPLLTTPQHA